MKIDMILCDMCIDGGSNEEVKENLWSGIAQMARNELENGLKVSDGLLDFLQHHETKLLDAEVRVEISSVEEPKERAQRLIQLLEKNEKLGFQCLVDGLKATNQTELLSLLEHPQPGK